MQVRGQQKVNRGTYAGLTMLNGSGSIMGLVHLRRGSAFDPAGAAVIVGRHYQKSGSADDNDSPDQRDYEVRETLCSM